MTQFDVEDLYIHFFEMDTPELLSVSFVDLSTLEREILKEVFEDRHNEINSMIDALREELNLSNKKKHTVVLPIEIISQVTAWNNLTESKSMVF
jgi:hypothetical protein